MSQYRFASIFDTDWDNLPPVLKNFFSVGSERKETKFTGNLNVTYKPWMWILRPLTFFFGLVVPTPGKNIRIDGQLKFTDKADIFQFNRDYVYGSNKTLRLYSNWQVQEPNRVIEYIGNHIGWRFVLSYEDGKVVLTHDSFVIKLFGEIFCLPLSWFIMGLGHAEQTATTETEMHIKMTLTHFIFGEYYRYEGILGGVI